MMKVIVFVNSEDPENMEFLEDDKGYRVIFNSYEEADEYLSMNAEDGKTYMKWNGER